jgi:4-amino-4-deoxy-L-arabinose transferase-like glycosyltransferase
MIGFVIEPSVVLHSLLLLSDTLFVFFVVCLYYWTLQKKHFSVSFSLLFGLCMGATILIRPIALFLLPVLVGIHIYINRPTLRSVITMSITMIVGVLLVVGPWMIRNHRVTGVYTVSSITGYNLLYYNVPMFVSYRDGISETDARKQVMQGIDQNNLQDASRSIELQERAMKYITSDIFHYALFHITSTQSFFFGSSIKTAVYTRNLLFSNDVDYASPQVSVVQRVIHGNLLEIAFLIERLLWLCIYLCIACGLYIKKTRRYIAFSIVLILYFALLTGPVSYTRYRLPALPFIAIALGVSIHGMYPHIQKRYQNNKGHQLY